MGGGAGSLADASLATGGGGSGGSAWPLFCAQVIFATQPIIPSQPTSPTMPMKRKIRVGVIMIRFSSDAICSRSPVLCP